MLDNQGGGLCTSVDSLRPSSVDNSSGCAWVVGFAHVPASDLFQAKVTNGRQSFEGSGPAKAAKIDF